jgi:hypothetical protein
MSVFATCTFDLRNASPEDYENAYSDLRVIGFRTSLVSSAGNTIRLPTTMTAGEFTGADATAVADALIQRVRSAFSARRFTSEIFITVGDNWRWRHHTT